MTITGEPRRRRSWGCGGCLLALLGIALLAVAVAVLINPWAVHIGDAFTPTMRWAGYGFATSPSGTPYGVYLQVQPTRRPQRSIHGGSSVTGNGIVCTAKSTFSFASASGALYAYLSTDGAKMNVSLGRGSGVAKGFGLTFQGIWQGATFLASDGGQIAEHTTPAGDYEPPPWAVPNPAAATTFAIRAGSASAFRTACQRLGGG